MLIGQAREVYNAMRLHHVHFNGFVNHVFNYLFHVVCSGLFLVSKDSVFYIDSRVNIEYDLFLAGNKKPAVWRAIDWAGYNKY
jgi:hypothetical protein